MKRKRKKRKPYTYRLRNEAPLEIVSCGDSYLSAWVPPEPGQKIRWTWSVPAHAHGVMFNYETP